MKTLLRTALSIILIAVMEASLFQSCAAEIVISVQASGDSTVIYCDAGNRYAAGRDIFGGGNIISPSLITKVSYLLDYAEGEESSLMLSDGAVFLAEGGETSVLLGPGEELENISYQGDKEQIDRVVDVDKAMGGTIQVALAECGGEEYGFACTSEGRVNYWGGDIDVKVANGLENICYITAGGGYLYAMDIEQRLYCFDPQTGKVTDTLEGLGILKIECTEDSWYAVGSEGSVLRGALDGSFDNEQYPGLSGITNISAGEGFVAALDSEGNVWTWGDNSEGQLCRETAEEEDMVPGKAEVDKVIALSCGRAHTVALCSDGSVALWGANNCGQLGQGNTDSTLGAVRLEIE